MISRRSLLQGLAAESAVISGVALAGCAPSEPPTLGPSALTDTGPSLRALARDRGLSLGTSVVAHWLIDPDYAALAGRHFARVTADAAGFMSIIQPTRGAANFTNFDRVVQFARAHDQTARLQALVWGRHTPETEDIFGGWTPTPGWILRGDLSRDQAITVMQQHIEKVLRRYRGRVRDYVVVNEPLHGDWRRTGLHPNVWLKRIGRDYFRLAFEHARRVDPDARLILNEWGADYRNQEHGPTNRPGRYYDFVADLVEQGTPIDGVGFQFHLEVGLSKPSVNSIVDHFERFRALGLSTHITEFDVRIPGPVTQAKLEEQARLYRTVIRAAIESPSTKDVMLFGFTDRFSWITAGKHYDGTIFPNHMVGTLMNNDFRLYPSFEAVRAELSA